MIRALHKAFLAWVCTVLLLVPAGVLAQAGSAQSRTEQGPNVVGPMVGALTMRSAKLWAQMQGIPPEGKDYPIWVEYRALDVNSNPVGGWLSSPVLKVNEQQSTVSWTLDGLQASTVYQYQVVWGDLLSPQRSEPLKLKTETLWQWRSDPPVVRILAGSCAYTNDAATDRPGQPYGQSPEIFSAMAAREPDVTLWLGDNVYFREADFDDRRAMAQRYDQWRRTPQLQPLLTKGRHLATWDDHDYGPNDSNASNPTKDLSLDVFKQYWANPSYGVPGLPGVFTQTRSADVEFFILDNRWYRDSDKLVDEDRAMLGAGQLRWLKNALTASTATWKLVVSGSQALNLKNNFEGWHKFPREQGEFLAWLERQKIPGVLLMSGDRHFSTLLKLERPGTYPLYELTCSPLTAGAYLNPAADLKDNDRIVPGSVVTQNNFCELEVSGSRGQRTLTLSIADRQGRRLWERKIPQSELR